MLKVEIWLGFRTKLENSNSQNATVSHKDTLKMYNFVAVSIIFADDQI